MDPMNAFVKMVLNHITIWINREKLRVVILTSALWTSTTPIVSAGSQWEAILFAKTRLVVLNANVEMDMNSIQMVSVGI